MKIKSYTDLGQSKILSKILKLESADMHYPWYIEEDGDTIESGHRITTPTVGNFTAHKVNKMILPCWSLAVLLEELNRNYWKVSLKCCGAEWDMTYDDGERHISVSADYAIDACVDMILKLKEEGKI